MSHADWAESVPPTIRRMFTPTEDYLCLVVWNMEKQKGITLRTTRPYIVFAQCLRKFIGKSATAQEIREGLRCLIDCGTTVHGNYLFYLAFEEDKIPFDEMHEVLPFIVMGDEEYRTDDPLQNSLRISELLGLNTEQFPARLARPKPKLDNSSSPVAKAEGPFFT